MSLISLFDPWQSKICSCPLKYSLSPYTGCGHKCLYCYASSYIRNFYHPRAKKDFLKRLSRELNKTPPSYITIANSSDPYLPLEKSMRLTQKMLLILKDYSHRIMLVTKSALIIRDLSILKEFKNLVISITLTTLNSRLCSKLEKFASTPRERLKTIERLSKYLPVVCRYDPLLYPLTTKEMKKIVINLKNVGVSQIISSTYKAKPDNFKRMCTAFPEYKKLWEKLYLKEGERISNYIYMPYELRKKLLEEVRDLSLRESIPFSTCREGLTSINTKICDGSAFFIE